MLTLTLRTINAHKVRLALTTFAVVLGVSFIVASFVLGDGLRRNFSSLSEEIVGGVDAEVQPATDFGSAPPLPGHLETAIEQLDGVRHAEGQVIADGIQPVAADGTPVTTLGAPLLGFSWIDDPELNSFVIVDGRAPEAGLEFAIDEDAAATNGLVIGGTYGVITPAGRVDMRLVGISRFGAENETPGAVLSQYPLATAQDLFGRVDQFDSISVAYEDGVDRAAVLAEISSLLPANATAVGQDQLLDDVTSDFTAGIDIFNNILLGFAGVALFVSIFIIANTFAIVLGQRTKELALLRAIGASPSQVLRSTLIEALIVGAVASGLGIIGGIGLNYGLQALFDALGAGLPATELIVATRTVVIACIVGIGVTVVSSVGPARRAARVAPLAAMRDGIDAPRSGDRRRNLGGVAVLVLGVVIGSAGLFADIPGTAPRITTLGVGAILTFLGLAIASPAVARPLIQSLGVPLRLLGTAGTLSTQNASRNPRRTASTAASLMIGLALVTTALVLGESIKQSISETLASEVRADYISSSDRNINGQLIDDLATSDSFDAVSGYRYDEVRANDRVVTVIGADLDATDRLFDLGIVDGEIVDERTSVALQQAEAIERSISVGDEIQVEFPNGSIEALRVSAIFENSTVIDVPYLISVEGWDQRFGDSTDVWAAALIADGVTVDEATATLAALEATYPQVTFENQTEFKQSIEAQIDQLLVVINAMLVLAIVVALIGIANTMALSVHERTREIGLLRAVGMTRRQSRRMIRWEAAQVALFGSLLGVGVGMVFGAGVVSALPDSFVSTLAFPAGRITALLGICAISGLLAAALPARRASKLNVLDAISHA